MLRFLIVSSGAMDGQTIELPAVPARGDSVYTYARARTLSSTEHVVKTEYVVRKVIYAAKSAVIRLELEPV